MAMENKFRDNKCQSCEDVDKGKASLKQSEISGVRRGRRGGPKYSVKDAVRMVLLCVENEPTL